MIAHFADLQLGFNYGPNGKSERRRQDVTNCFDAMVWEIIQRQPSTVLFVGDIFHFANPRRTELLRFQYGLRKLSARLPDTSTIIVVSGNHDTPKASGDVHPLRLFEHIDKVFCVWEEPMLVETVDGMVYAVPWVWGEPLPELSGIEGADILAVHAPVLELLPEQARDTQVRYLNPDVGLDYKYVALGDFHARRKLDHNVVMPGALEHTSFGEAGALTGGVFVMLKGAEVKTDFWDSPSRPMHLVELDLTGKPDPDNVLTAALQAIMSGNDDPLVRLTVRGVDPTLVEAGALARKFPHVKIKWVDSPAPPVLSSFTPGEVNLTWTQFAKKNNLPSDVLQLGSEALQVVGQNR
jgi:DNA repair exonuclease SbcCD nuclease subunit